MHNRDKKKYPVDSTFSILLIFQKNKKCFNDYLFIKFTTSTRLFLINKKLFEEQNNVIIYKASKFVNNNFYRCINHYSTQFI